MCCTPCIIPGVLRRGTSVSLTSFGACLCASVSEWCSADPSLALLCLFICFPHSVNFSTRQLKKTALPNNLVHKKTAFLPSAVSSSQGQCKWPIISSSCPRKITRLARGLRSQIYSWFHRSLFSSHRRFRLSLRVPGQRKSDVRRPT